MPPDAEPNGTQGEPKRKKAAPCPPPPGMEPLLTGLEGLCGLVGVSPRQGKRIVAEHRDWIVRVGRRRLLLVAKIREWVSLGCPRAEPKARPRRR